LIDFNFFLVRKRNQI